MQEGTVISIIFLIFIIFRIWWGRELIKNSFFAGWNIMREKAGMPPYIPKRKEEKCKYQKL